MASLEAMGVLANFSEIVAMAAQLGREDVLAWAVRQVSPRSRIHSSSDRLAVLTRALQWQQRGVLEWMEKTGNVTKRERECRTELEGNLLQNAARWQGAAPEWVQQWLERNGVPTE